MQIFCFRWRNPFLSRISSVTLAVGLVVAVFAHSSQSQAFTAQIELAEIAQAAPNNTFPDDESLDGFVEEMMAERQIPGLSLAVIHDRKLIKTQSYGFLNTELKVKTRPSSIFPIASMSKPLTATAIMLLVQEGKVELDAPIGTYLADAPDYWQEITVRRLLDHTAGLSESVYAENSWMGPDDFIEKAAIAPLDFEPGESWMYSNTGYSLASSLIEEVSGDTFSAFMANRMFEPIGMNHTDVIRDSYLLSNHAMGYFADGNDSLQPLSQVLRDDNSIRKIMHGLQGAGSVTSNVLDLARWEIALQKGQLLDSAMQAEMYELGIMTSGKRAGYGLGWFVKDINGHTAISHGGNLWGYSTSIARFPDDQLTVIVLTNKNGEDGDRIARKIAEQYIPDLAIDGNAPAIADPTPAITEQILAFVNGDETAIEMTPEDQIALTSTVRGRQMYAQWVERSSQNPVKELELLAVASHPNGTKHRYRATTDNGARLLSIVITPDGFISGMDMSLEDG